MSWLKVLFTVDKHQISLCWILKPLLNWIVIVDSINIDDNLLIFTHVFLYIRLINHFKNLVLMLSFKNFKIKKKTILFVHVGHTRFWYHLCALCWLFSCVFNTVFEAKILCCTSSDTKILHVQKKRPFHSNKLMKIVLFFMTTFLVQNCHKICLIWLSITKTPTKKNNTTL